MLPYHYHHLLQPMPVSEAVSLNQHLISIIWRDKRFDKWVQCRSVAATIAVQEFHLAGGGKSSPRLRQVRFLEPCIATGFLEPGASGA